MHTIYCTFPCKVVDQQSHTRLTTPTCCDLSNLPAMDLDTSKHDNIQLLNYRYLVSNCLPCTARIQCMRWVQVQCMLTCLLFYALRLNMHRSGLLSLAIGWAHDDNSLNLSSVATIYIAHLAVAPYNPTF